MKAYMQKRYAEYRNIYVIQANNPLKFEKRSTSSSGVKNNTVSSAAIFGSRYVGGYLNTGTVSGWTVSDTTVSSPQYAGGVVGKANDDSPINYNQFVKDCTIQGNVTVTRNGSAGNFVGGTGTHQNWAGPVGCAGITTVINS